MAFLDLSGYFFCNSPSFAKVKSSKLIEKILEVIILPPNTTRSTFLNKELCLFHKVKNLFFAYNSFFIILACAVFTKFHTLNAFRRKPFFDPTHFSSPFINCISIISAKYLILLLGWVINSHNSSLPKHSFPFIYLRYVTDI